MWDSAIDLDQGPHELRSSAAFLGVSLFLPFVSSFRILFAVAQVVVNTVIPAIASTLRRHSRNHTTSPQYKQVPWRRREWVNVQAFFRETAFTYSAAVAGLLCARQVENTRVRLR